MPTFTLGEIMSYATTRAGRRWDMEASTASFYANLAIMEVATMAAMAQSETSYVSSSTTGQSRITLPGDLLEPVSITLVWPPSWSTASSVISSRQTLARISREEADVRGPHPVGTPTAFVFDGDSLEVVPSFDSAYSIILRYRSLPSDLTATAAVPSLSTPWRWAAVLKATQYVYEHYNNPTAAAEEEQKYLSYVGGLKTDEARRQSGAFRIHVTPMGWNDVR